MDVTLNPFAPEFQEDPYPTYRQLRESAPVYPAHFMGFRFVVLTRYEDVAAALRDQGVQAAAEDGTLGQVHDADLASARESSSCASSR